MPIASERGAVQNPFIRYAVEAGWTYISPDDALRLRPGSRSPVLFPVLVQQLQKLNPRVVDERRADDVARAFCRVRPNKEGNLDAWEYLKGLKTVFVETEKQERNVKLLDVAQPEANVFHVTDELTFSRGTPPDIRTDINFLVNGIPLLVVETKAAKKREGISEALDDMRYYHQHGPELLALVQLYALTHLIQFFYGATWNTRRKDLFNWREETAGDFETLVKTFVAPRRLLRIVSDFILFTRKDGDLDKVVLRPHQMRAVERCLVRAKDPEKDRGLIWHTQGSGKTYTMIALAKRLIEDPIFQNPTVLLIVDRNELEAQLFGNVEAVGFRHVEVADSKKDLQQLIKADRRGLIVSMIHKFDDMPESVRNERKNIFVLVDEAHRTTGGHLGNYLMGALPNATYLGFTGTPIDRTAYGKGTFKVFGAQDEKGFLDKYTIRESVDDGTTVPLHYALAPNELRVDRATLETEFLKLAEAEGVSDIEELNKILERAVTLKNMLKNRDRVDSVARFVAKHFHSTVEPMGYKGFLVAVDREACVLYKEALDKYLPPQWSQVVMSSGGKGDSDELRRHHLEEAEEQAIRKAFRKPIGAGPAPVKKEKYQELRILIVTEKLLTGFDAPILYCMYLDKPMRDHVLLQAIARVNRPYEDEGRRKPAGFVLDFVGIFERLEDALAFDSEDVSGVVQGLDVLKRRFEEQIEAGQRDYVPIPQGQTGDKAAEAVLEHFRDEERRNEFYEFFNELEELYEILSPDPFLRTWLPDYQKLAEFYELLRACYDMGAPVDRSVLRKTAQLVQAHTLTGCIRTPDKVHKLDSKTLEQIAAQEQPDTVKVFNLLKNLNQLVKDKAAQQPVLVSIGEKAEEIASAFQDRQKTTQDTLAELEELLCQLADAENRQAETDLTPDAFAVFWLLERQGVPKALEVAQGVAAAFEQFPHWLTSEHQEQEVRRAIYKALINANVEGIIDVANGILKMLRRAVS
jgi:type I restriction enzyme R subunit